jgi:hypothetical protein
MKNILAILTVLFSLSCKGAVTADATLPAIDMQGAESIVFDELVEDVECVLLENHPSGYLQGCWKIIEYDDRYYLYSLDDFRVSIFKRSGEFVQTVSNRIQGKIVMPCDIFIHKENRQLWIIESPDVIAKYSPDGQFIERQKLPFQAVKMADAGNGHYLFYDGGFDRQNPCFLRMASGHDFSESSTFVRKYIRNHTHIPLSLFAADDERIYAFLPYNDTLYVCNRTEKKVSPCRLLDFHGEFLTHREMPEEGYSMEAFDKILRENRKITDIRGFHCVRGWLFMKPEGRDYSFRMIDLKNSRACRFDTLIDGIKTAPQGSTENSLIISLPVQEVVKIYSGRQGRTKYTAVEAVLKQLKPEDNSRTVFKIKLKNRML